MSSTEIISWFADIGLSDTSHVGGKGGSLGELQRAGIVVPPGFVVKTSAFERFVQTLERKAPLRSRIEAINADDLVAVAACCMEIRNRVEAEALPQDIRDEIASAYTALCGPDTNMPVAVRSSATTEDSVDSSFAGLQDTYLWVTHLDQALRSVRSCWASLYSLESVTYRRKRGLPEDSVAMAVVVQKMVNARTAGVMFTRSPTTGDRSVITVEGAWGLGSAVVGGEVTPDRWVLSKITGDISVRDISDKAIRHVPIAQGGIDGAHDGGIESVAVADDLRRKPSMSDEELQRLRAIARKVEFHYRRPQDIEWAVDSSNEIFLLQSRPETVWSMKDVAPIARSTEDPLMHVMSIFGGKR